MGLVVRDIESRSTIDLGDVGPHLYAAHPTTEVLSYGYCVDNGPLRMWHPNREPVPKAFRNGATWVAHNAAFEMAIERSILVPRYGFPVIPIERQRCTMAQVNALAYPGGLDKVAKILELKNQKDDVGARLMKKLARPRKPRKGEDPNGVYYLGDAAMFKQLDTYCMRDTAATREIFLAYPQLSDEEQLIWQLDQLINDRGFYLDRELAEAAARIAAAMKPRINDELTKITNGEITASTQAARITKWVKQHIGETTLGKAVVLELLEHHQALPDHVRRVLELRLLGAQAAVAKVGALLQRQGADGRVRGSFVYHAAGPGRWSSRGAQVHNLKRSMTEDINHAIEVIGTGDVDLALKEYKNPLSVIGDCIRGMIIAAPGHTLIGGDFSGIEARVTAWIAQDEPALVMYRDYDAGRGPDPYIVTAGEIVDTNPLQLAIDYKANKPVAREQRQIGKAAVLAFGFQGGVKAYRKFAPTTKLTDLEIDEIKDIWRAAHPRIASFWVAINNAIIRAVDNRDPDNPESVRVNCPIEVGCGERRLWIRLPSGRLLSYPDAADRYYGKGKKGIVIGNEDTDNVRRGVVFMDNGSGAWRPTAMYGGLATENIVQAIARDLLAEAMLRVEAAGYRVVAHIHDEIVIEAPLKHAARIQKDFTRLMMVTPDWAEGLPIMVNSWINRRYTK